MKNNKERATLLLSVNKTDNHKLKPLCTDRSESPLSFKHVNMQSLPVMYKNSSSA
jgi:hypothetical protein